MQIIMRKNVTLDIKRLITQEDGSLEYVTESAGFERGVMYRVASVVNNTIVFEDNGVAVDVGDDVYEIFQDTGYQPASPGCCG